MPPGTSLGHYEIEAVLGAGGMGVVYRGRDLRLARPVAIKMLPPELAEEAESMARLRREARMLAAVSHPGIAEIHSVEEVDGGSFLVMELVDGESLADVLERGPLPLNRALDVAMQIASALEVAHAAGIVHRDLKPGNVMLPRDAQAKLVDFGLARAFGRDDVDAESAPTATLTRTGVLVTTVPYMSPEQVRGGSLDHGTDIWAFGCLLFEMLSGCSPFGRETPVDTLSAILDATPDFSSLPTETPAMIRVR